MRIKKLRKSVVDLNLKTSKNKYALDTAPEDPKLPALFVFCGSRGVERLMPVWHWLSMLKKWRYITRTFLICPTKSSNDIFKNLQNIGQ